jgi:hypothetical protein
MKKNAFKINEPSEASCPDSATAAREEPAASRPQTGIARSPCIPNPFGPGTPEADALRGAMSFLFTLIVFYEELIDSRGAANRGDRSGAAKLQ